MSSANNTFGTNSPSLEATGSEQPMGVSSVGGDKPQAVTDKQQRQEYFQDERGGDPASSAEGHEQKREKIKVD
ncbi:hypothetical protein C8Q80DRAFT_1265995 [Daedaleopsis nitida]|nr:hypothetical protein C8Q80DRAFT_1265995 [Daedaleopsis nitida]